MKNETQSNKRKIFLDHYLRLFGAKNIIYSRIESDKVYGTLIYDPNKPEELQDFCWHMTEENVPSDKVIELIEILRINKFISIDKLIVSEEEVFTKINESDYKKFEEILDELFNVEVRMVDDGEETDGYFIHN